MNENHNHLKYTHLSVSAGELVPGPPRVPKLQMLKSLSRPSISVVTYLRIQPAMDYKYSSIYSSIGAGGIHVYVRFRPVLLKGQL